MAATTAPLPVQLNKEMKFAARRVPDFAKLHALEDARLARWKKEHKKDVTVPLNFRLASAPISSQAAHLNSNKPTTPSHGHGHSHGPASARSAGKSAVQSNGGRSLAGSYAASVASENTGITDSSINNKGMTKPRESGVPGLSFRSDHCKENEVSQAHYNTIGETLLLISLWLCWYCDLNRSNFPCQSSC
jgi:hypothetical protein